ncbi:MAG: hypothetical protein ACPIOQ_75750, partial [Promethearchaeia archaeon]
LPPSSPLFSAHAPAERKREPSPQTLDSGMGGIRGALPQSFRASVVEPIDLLNRQEAANEPFACR